jgi:hypothetical protein
MRTRSPNEGRTGMDLELVQFNGAVPDSGRPRALLRDPSSRATKAFDPALSMCDLIASGVLERHRRFRLAILELEPAWAPHLLHDGLHLRRVPLKVRTFTTDLDWPAEN